MKKLAMLALVSAITLCAQFTPDDSTRLSYQVPAFSRTGERKMEARDVMLDTFGKKGRPMKRRLIVLFDQVTGYFLFEYEGDGQIPEELEGDKRLTPTDAQRKALPFRAYISEHDILIVTPLLPILSIAKSSEKAASIDDAQRQAIEMLTAHVLEATRAFVWPAAQMHSLLVRGSALLGIDFRVPPGSSFAAPVNVVGIAESPEGWEITLQGQYKARVTLSPSFQALKAERVDPPKPRTVER